MKYVVIKVEDYPTTDPRAEAIIREMPVVFPEHMVHSMVYDSLAHMLRLEVLGTKRRRELSCVGAGFMSSTVFPAIGDSFCHGKSESLNVKSRGTEDDALFSMYDYHHGIK